MRAGWGIASIAAEPTHGRGVPCAATVDTSVGASCSLSSTFNAVVPGSVVEGKRAIWQLGKVEVFDAGADEQAGTTNDNTLFEHQGIFVP